MPSDGLDPSKIGRLLRRILLSYFQDDSITDFFPLTQNSDRSRFGFEFCSSTRPTILNSKSFTVPNTAIWHDGVGKDDFIEFGSLQVSSYQNCFSQVGVAQVSSTQIGFGQIGIAESSFIESHSSQVSFSQIGVVETGPAQAAISQVSSGQISIIQTGIGQSTITQIGSSQNGTGKVYILQPIATEVSSTQIDSIQVPAQQFNIRKISFSEDISLEQFFSTYSGHNTSPTSIYDINNTALNLWNTYLQPTTPLNLTIEIKDLPTGQLAEAQITQFSNNGTPQAALSI